MLERTRTESDVQAELDSIQDVVGQERSTSLREVIGGRLRPLLVIGIALAVIQQFAGINTVIYFDPGQVAGADRGGGRREVRHGRLTPRVEAGSGSRSPGPRSRHRRAGN